MSRGHVQSSRRQQRPMGRNNGASMPMCVGPSWPMNRKSSSSSYTTFVTACRPRNRQIPVGLRGEPARSIPMNGAAIRRAYLRKPCVAPTISLKAASMRLSSIFRRYAKVMKMKVAFILLVTIMTVSPAFAQESGWIGASIADQTDRGVLVRSVEANSPAEKAGIRANDVILQYNKQEVVGALQLTRLVSETPAGRTVDVTV